MTNGGKIAYKTKWTGCVLLIKVRKRCVEGHEDYWLFKAGS